MKMLRLLLSGVLSAMLAAMLTIPAQAATPSLPAATDLAHDAEQSAAVRKPVVLFFTQPGCSYCRIVRYDYLQPMMLERGDRDPVLLREVSITGQRMLRAHDGRMMNESELAARYRVQMTPTLMFIGPDGESLAEAIIGGNHPDYLRLFNRLHEEAAGKLVGKRVRILR